MLSHLVSTGRFFHPNPKLADSSKQNSLLAPEITYLCLLSIIGAPPHTHTYLTSFEVQAGDPAQTLVLELAESILSTEP